MLSELPTRVPRHTAVMGKHQHPWCNLALFIVCRCLVADNLPPAMLQAYKLISLSLPSLWIWISCCLFDLRSVEEWPCRAMRDPTVEVKIELSSVQTSLLLGTFVRLARCRCPGISRAAQYCACCGGGWPGRWPRQGWSGYPSRHVLFPLAPVHSSAQPGNLTESQFQQAGLACARDPSLCITPSLLSLPSHLGQIGLKQ